MSTVHCKPRRAAERTDDQTACVVLLAAASVIGCVSAYILGADWTESLFSAGLACLATRLARTDIRSFTLSDLDIAATFSLGLCWSQFTGNNSAAIVLCQSAVYSGGLFIVATLYRAARSRSGLGFGDVKLAAAAGPWLEPGQFAHALLLSACLGLIYFTLRGLEHRRRFRLSAHIPFGALFAPAIWAIWLLR